jgi:hypothetical protein
MIRVIGCREMYIFSDIFDFALGIWMRIECPQLDTMRNSNGHFLEERNRLKPEFYNLCLMA